MVVKSSRNNGYIFAVYLGQLGLKVPGPEVSEIGGYQCITIIND